ncbi:MAG: radical SAM protein [Chloroflexota bacterium]|nr:radical SAM protein [Chloroflexota bacterium]
MCSEIVDCPGSEESICLGCGSCVIACQSGALKLEDDPREGTVSIEVNGNAMRVPERITVKDALIKLDFPAAIYTEDEGVYAPCEVGGCWACVVDIDGEIKRSCRVGVKDGMKVTMTLPNDYVPRRVILGFSGHPVGGVGTPWEDKIDSGQFAEVVCFAAGCNFRCPQCQNWHISYRGTGEPMIPGDAAKKLTLERDSKKVNRLTISGGEATLNRSWLVQFIRELRRLNPEPFSHLHVDTNGSLLTHDYIDELVESGMTDVGIDLKASDLNAFMSITGLNDSTIAEKYQNTAWEAVRYISKEYEGKVFLGVGFPYNRELNPITEVSNMANRLIQISRSIPVTVLNYRPEFRSKIAGPGDNEMKGVYQVLKEVGLETVLCQTTQGHIGP